MLEIEKQQVRLVKTTSITENHGEELVPALDLTIEANLPNTHLHYFDKSLLKSLYRKASAEEGTDLATDPDGLTKLKFSPMSPFSWDWEGTGYNFVADYGIGGESDIKLRDCKIRNFTITPLEGGTILLRFHISCKPDELNTGRLCFRQKDNIDITLLPPDAKNVRELFGEAA